MQLLAGIEYLFTATLFRIGTENISLLWLFKLILTFVGVIVITNQCKKFLKNRLLTKLGLSEGPREAVSILISYSAGTIAFLLVLQVNGLNLAPLLVTLGGLGVGIGFGLQEITKNLVSGWTLLIEGKLQVGDYVEFDGVSGYIKEISVRSTMIRTFEGGDMVVPNSSLTSNKVLNWSYENFPGKIILPFGLAHDSDPILVTETLLSSAYLEPYVLQEPPPKVIFKGFSGSSLDFELWVWIGKIAAAVDIKSSLHFIIEYNFRTAGLRMSVPQQQLWPSNPGVYVRQKEKSAIQDSNGISIRKSLQQFPLFKLCSDLHLRRLVETGYRKTLDESTVLFREGEMGNDFYLILSGSVETVVTKLDKQIKIYQAGDLFGEVPIMLTIPYVVTARTVEETSLFVIRRSSFEKLLHLCPKLAEAFAEEITKEKEIYSPIREQLQELGLLNINEQDQGFITWMGERLKNLFISKVTVK